MRHPAALPSRISRCDVQIFVATCAQQDRRDLDQAWALLDDGERAHAGGLRRDDDRQDYVVAHALLRCVLARWTGERAADLRFSVTAHGRPELAPGGAPGRRPPVRFNLAHTRGLVGCAVTATQEVGFDLEDAGAPAPLEVASRFFSPAELARLRVLPPARQSERFYALWVLKESYIKGRGLGLALALDSFTVHPSPDGRARLMAQKSASRRPWTLRWWRLAEQRMAGLAVQESSRRVRVALSAGQRIHQLAQPDRV